MKHEGSAINNDMTAGFSFIYLDCLFVHVVCVSMKIKQNICQIPKLHRNPIRMLTGYGQTRMELAPTDFSRARQFPQKLQRVIQKV